ncbi:hypothetical protein [Bdellovibrio svalbardensis]|uniref:Transposase n=1 Tax=Bdellovibrio svalbardensis TaxID=2972972 RepID=A0ABT6DGN8_9BACT|nr:hypothetical protein [Bdellovibrio svalbardensis]MDG0815982.1 hypothetical protein [Bdellovibrio svalbardensis]
MSQLSIQHRKCPHCGSLTFVKRGYFYKKSTKTYIPRYNCKHCLKTYSTRTHSPTFKQIRSDLNAPLFRLLTGGVSIRESARILDCSYKTAYLKSIWLGRLAKSFHLKQRFIIQELQFDEMFSIEHTKLKPLSILLAVDDKYRIIGAQVAKTKATGLLAAISYKKYGPRPNETSKKIPELLHQIREQSGAIPLIKTDENPHYQTHVKKIFKGSTHQTFLSAEQKEKSREQKYLSTEKKKFDPLFAVNHTCAKLRDHIKRLARRSWCITKQSEHLELAIYLYIAKINQYKLL